MLKKYSLEKPPSLAKTIGPSFILLGLALGSGELILWPYLAANYGLGLLWGALLGVSLQYVLNTEVMRYTLAKGESIFLGFRRMSVFITIWYIFSTFIPWSIPGFSSAASEVLTTVFPILPEKIVAVGLLLFTGIILSTGSSLYKTMERFQKIVILAGLPLLFGIAFFMAQGIHWQEMALGLVGKGDGWWFFPTGVSIASFLGAFAYAGAGGNLNLAQSYYIKEKGFGMGKYAAKVGTLFSKESKPVAIDGHDFSDTPQNTQRWNAWWRLVSIEHFLVFWVLGLVTIIIMSVLARATVYGTEVASGLSFLYGESAIISAQLGTTVATFFLLVAALMLFSTQLGVLESSARIISENVLLLGYKKGQKVNMSLGFYIALWAQILLGIGIYSYGVSEPRILLTVSALLNAAAMMMSFVFVYFLNRKALQRKLQAGVLRVALMVVGFCFFSHFLINTFLTYFQGQ